MSKIQRRNERRDKKYIIEFNSKLDVIHDKSKRDGEVVEDPGIFKPQRCMLNFNENFIEFTFAVHYVKLKMIKIKKKFVFFTLFDQNGSPNLRLPIEKDEVVHESGEMATIVIQANVRNHFLDLFSFNKKQFAFTFEYAESDKLTCFTTYVVPIPTIDDQTDWDPHVKYIEKHLPQEVGGFALVRLFKNLFRLNESTTAEEKNLLMTMRNYSDAEIDDRFGTLDFLRMFQLMIAIEDLEGNKSMESYQLERQVIFKYFDCPFQLRDQVNQHLRHAMCEDKLRDLVRKSYIFEADRKLPLDVVNFQEVHVTDMQDYQNFHDDDEELARLHVVGRITHIFGKIVLFYIPRQREKRAKIEIDTHRVQKIDFVPNRITYRVTQRALKTAKTAHLHEYLVGFESENFESNTDDFYDFEWLNAELRDNEEQQLAVENILNRTSFPSPFIIFGGPGTGKTSTLVEAIAQVVKLKPKAHVLVTASSNATCDDIGNRLLRYVSINKLLRIYSPSFDQKPERIDPTLQKVSNFRGRKLCQCGKRSCPVLENDSDSTYEEFYTARVVICTLASCGRLVNAGISAQHFNYIFIDEAASEMEPVAYIPIVDLGLISNGRVNAQIVLSGDHKQLGPIVTNSFAKKMGLEMSLMERLMKTDPKYQRRNNSYDNDFVVQLKKNFRNHPAILRFSNENFYNSQLVPMCSDAIRTFALDEDILMFNNEFPVLFHSTKWRSEEVGTSLKNEGELGMLAYYLEVILKKGLNGNVVTERDIGVISPYCGQRDRMLEVLGHRAGLEIGTVDAFQGREKKVILMSCVRSGTKHVGFLKNEKRLNVSLTRAQSLLIVIGNAETLQKSPIWNKFIAYCSENFAVVGDIKSINRPAIDDPSMAEKEEPLENGVEDEYDE